MSKPCDLFSGCKHMGGSARESEGEKDELREHFCRETWIRLLDTACCCSGCCFADCSRFSEIMGHEWMSHWMNEWRCDVQNNTAWYPHAAVLWKGIKGQGDGSWFIQSKWLTLRKSYFIITEMNSSVKEWSLLEQIDIHFISQMMHAKVKWKYPLSTFSPTLTKIYI